MKYHFYNAIDFELNIFGPVTFWKKVLISYYELKFYYKSGFELKFLQRVRFWIKKRHNASDFETCFTMSQILNLKKDNASDFEFA